MDSHRSCRDLRPSSQQGHITHHSCCEIEMHRANDAIRWNIEKNTEFKIAHESSDTHVLMNYGCLRIERVNQIEEVVNQVEESVQVSQKQPNAAEEPSDFSARQVLDKMPKSWLDKIAKNNEQLVDDIGWEAKPLGLVERLDDVKALEEGKPRDAIPTTHALKLEFSEQA